MCVASNFGDLSASRASSATCRQSIFRATNSREQVQLVAAQTAGFFNQDEGAVRSKRG
jgi:hypothetical protein